MAGRLEKYGFALFDPPSDGEVVRFEVFFLHTSISLCTFSLVCIVYGLDAFVFAGCRIKALRAKTNTYIKTPVRGEEPVFIITGRPEDVSSAKREILTAAEHFTNIRAKRASSTTSESGGSTPSDGETRVSVMVRVPYRVVGLVVGPRGTTVKRIQQLTNTYIVTPSRDKEPAFEVRGSPENVAKAKAEIQSYIALRTGGGSADNPDSPDSLYDVCGGSATAFSTLDESLMFSPESNNSYMMPGSAPPTEQMFNFPSFSDSLVYMNPSLPRPNPVRHLASNIVPTKYQPPSPTYSCDSGSSDGFSTNSPKQFYNNILQVAVGKKRASCYLCDNEVTAALVPCGHNLFCMSCALNIVKQAHRCPVCGAEVNNSLRILSR